MRGRAFLISLATTVVLMVALIQHSHSELKLHQRWFVPSSVSGTIKDSPPYFSESTKMMRPIVTKMRKFGGNEVVMVIHKPPEKPSGRISQNDGEYFLSISKWDVEKQELVQLHKKRLHDKLMVNTGKRPVALSCGKLSAITEGDTYCVVVTETWMVLLYSNELKLLWEYNIRDEIPQGKYFRDVSILLSSLNIAEGDLGSVYVGGRVGSYETSLGLTHGVDGHRHAEETTDENETDVNYVFGHMFGEESEKHFSTYAFDGRTGSLRWSHEHGDYMGEGGVPGGEGDGEEDRRPEHEFKLYRGRGLKHYGEKSWSAFRSSMIEQLPHRWTAAGDTFFAHSKFRRDKLSTKLRDPEDLEEEPNALVSHTGDGISATHLFTGRPICHLSLEPGKLYADIDGDCVIDTINGVSGKNLYVKDTEQQPIFTPRCVATARSGIAPPYTTLWSRSLLGKATNFFARIPLPENIKSAAERIVVGAKSEEEMKVYAPEMIGNDIVFHVSNGLVSSFDEAGNLRFSRSTQSQWHKSREEEKNMFRGNTQTYMQFLEQLAIPHMVPIQVHMRGTRLAVETQIAVVGYDTLTLISPKNGDIISTLSLPGVPVEKTVVGDFDNDGNTDVIVITYTGFFGYSVSGSLDPYLKFASSVVGLFLVASVLIYMRMVLFRSTDTEIEGSPKGERSNEQRTRKEKSVVRNIPFWERMRDGREHME